MESRHLKKIDFFVIIWSLLLCSGSVFLWDLQIFSGVAIGSLLGIANWIGFRALMTRLLSDNKRKKYQYAILLAVKSLAVFTLVGLIVMYTPVEKFAFILGLSSLMLGIFTYSFKSIFSTEGEAAVEKDF